MSRALLLACLVIVSSPLPASDKAHEGEEILEQARSKSDIRELRSFTMKAAIKIEVQGKTLAGEYTFLWNGPNQWREETSLPGFDEIRVGGPGTVALKRNLDFVPLRISQLGYVLGYARGGLTLRSDEEIKRVRNRKVNGIAARCVEIVGKVYPREICVDASTGAMARDVPFADKEFAPIGTKIFPRFLSYTQEGKTVAQAELTELNATDPLPPSAFAVPAGAVSHPSCLNPAMGRLINRVSPAYPDSAKRAHVQGTVYIYAAIGNDGSLHNLRIVSGVSPDLNEASLAAVQQWRYEPYTCQNTPVEVESVIQVNYKLSY